MFLSLLSFFSLIIAPREITEERYEIFVWISGVVSKQLKVECLNRLSEELDKILNKAPTEDYSIFIKKNGDICILVQFLPPRNADDVTSDIAGLKMVIAKELHLLSEVSTLEPDEFKKFKIAAT